MKPGSMVLILFITTVFVRPALADAAPLCRAEEYYSDYSSACEPLVLQVGLGDQTESLNLTALAARARITERTIEENPAFIKTNFVAHRRTYRGFLLLDVIRSLLPRGANLKDYSLATTALDGFNPVLGAELLTTLTQNTALLAFEQKRIDHALSGVTRDGRWEIVPAEWGPVGPGPFYIMWKNPKSTYPAGWPFQLNSLRLVKTADLKATQAKLEPKDAKLKEGFAQFQGKCLACHSFLNIGGKKAHFDFVTLIKPLSLAQTEDLLRGAIKNPPPEMESIRAVKLSDADLVNIAAYLKGMSN